MRFITGVAGANGEKMKAFILIIAIIVIIWICKRSERKKRSGSKTSQTTTIKIKMPDPEKQKAIQYKQLQRERKEKEYARKEQERTEKEKINRDIALSNNIQYDNSIQELRKQYDYYESIECDCNKPDKMRIAANNKKVSIDRKIMDLNNKILKNQLYIK